MTEIVDYRVFRKILDTLNFKHFYDEAWKFYQFHEVINWIKHFLSLFSLIIWNNPWTPSSLQEVFNLLPKITDNRVVKTKLHDSIMIWGFSARLKDEVGICGWKYRDEVIAPWMYIIIFSFNFSFAYNYFTSPSFLLSSIK